VSTRVGRGWLSRTRTRKREVSPAELLAKAQRDAKRRAPIAKLLLQIKAWKLPEPEEEIEFHPVRRWRLDLGWREFKLAVELDGVTYAKDGNHGRHQQAQGFEKDREKDLAARELGWDVIHVTPRQVFRGEAIRAIASALERITGVRA
jgi:hypothetical protein